MRKTTSYLVVESWEWYYVELLLGTAACPAQLTLHQLCRQQHAHCGSGFFRDENYM